MGLTDGTLTMAQEGRSGTLTRWGETFTPSILRTEEIVKEFISLQDQTLMIPESTSGKAMTDQEDNNLKLAQLEVTSTL